MKIYHSKKVFSMLISGMMLFPLTGCNQKKEIVIQEGPSVTPVIEPTLDRNVQESFEEETVENTDSDSKSVVKVEAEKERDVVDAIMDSYDKVVAYLNSEDFKEKEDRVLWYFFDITDFLFYGKEKNGVTLKELSIEAQLQLMEMYDKVDGMIEERYPNYQEKVKDKFGETWKVLKGKTKDALQYLNGVAKEKLGEEKYQEYMDKITTTTTNWKDRYQAFKDAHGDEIKQGVSDIWDNVKEGGSKVKDKVSDWYQSFKEEHTK